MMLLIMVSMMFVMVPRAFASAVRINQVLDTIPEIVDHPEAKTATENVSVNGIDVRDMTQESLRLKIGFIPQKAVLFTGTIQDNIGYGMEDAADEDIRYAAEITQTASFIAEKKEGYEPVIAQGGSNLSDGQKQRILPTLPSFVALSPRLKY